MLDERVRDLGDEGRAFRLRSAVVSMVPPYVLNAGRGRPEGPDRAGRVRTSAALLALSASTSALSDRASHMMRPTSREVGLVEAAHRHRRRPHAEARGDGGRPLVERDRVAIDRDPDLRESVLCVPAAPFGAPKIDEQKVRIGTTREHVQPALLNRFCQRIRVRPHRALVFAERLRRGDPEAGRLRRDHVVERAPCIRGKTARSSACACSARQRMNPDRGPAERLVRRRRLRRWRRSRPGSDAALPRRARVKMRPCGSGAARPRRPRSHGSAKPRRCVGMRIRRSTISFGRCCLARPSTSSMRSKLRGSSPATRRSGRLSYSRRRRSSPP